MIDNRERAGRFAARGGRLSELMSFRVREVLLVASPYDAFVLEEDGELTELMYQEYRDLGLNVRDAPRFVTAESGTEALEVLANGAFQLVVSTARLPDMTPQALGQRIKGDFPGLPVCVLAAHPWDLPHRCGLRTAGVADWVLVWQGGVRTLLAVIAQEEDRRNADHDILECGVQAIVLVEDDVRFLSFLLPHIYTELTQQTARLLREGLNLSDRLLRLQARPKLLLADTYEKASQLIERYGDRVLGVISDVGFARDGRPDPAAGLALAAWLHDRDPDLPVLLQSSDAGNRAAASALGASFLAKDSRSALSELRTFMLARLGFGDFVFRTPDGAEVSRATDSRQFLDQLQQVPEATVEYHAGHNHFSRWFVARTEFELASQLRPRRVSEFSSVAHLRHFLVQAVHAYLRDVQRHVIIDFDAERYDELSLFAKIGSGSLGGKGRGLAFMQRLIAQESAEFEGVEVTIPQTLVLATDLFEGFVEANGLRPILPELVTRDDAAILDAFRQGRFEGSLRADLARLLDRLRAPLAVRSSSLLEDSPYQPFAGVYATIMLPNNHPSLDVRLAQILEAIKVVYASTYMATARSYLETTPHRMEEERMAVVVQRLVGSAHNGRYYPSLSGLASSHNFYPFRDMRPEDGVTLVALGLGKSVVEGFEVLRFCPAFPQVLPQFSSTRDVLRAAQRRFWALDLGQADTIPGLAWDANLVNLEVTEARGDDGVAVLFSTYLRSNDAIVDGLASGGSPLVTFSRLLRGGLFRFPELLVWLLRITRRGLGVPTEIEFAMDLLPEDSRQIFHVLQVRPMIVEPQPLPEELEERSGDVVLAASTSALGHGRCSGISDLVVVLPTLDRAGTAEAAGVLERLNLELVREGRPFALIGPGRWGSRDPWLGIPVAWSQISGVKAIVETDFADLDIDASQGSHFFHNLTSFDIPFLAVHRRHGDGTVAWDWLTAQPAVSEALGGCVRHVRLDRPVEVLVDGAGHRGMVVLRGP